MSKIKNPKFFEIALQVGGSHYPEVGGELLEKFAELLVVKCANIVWDEAEKTMNKEINEVGYELLKQFGIEE